jgi:hypothetical protein
MGSVFDMWAIDLLSEKISYWNIIFHPSTVATKYSQTVISIIVILLCKHTEWLSTPLIFLDKLTVNQMVKYFLILWNLKFYYHFPKVTILSKCNSFHKCSSCSAKIHINIIFLSMSMSSLRFSFQNVMYAVLIQRHSAWPTHLTFF